MSVVMLVTRGASQLGRVQSGFMVGLLGAQPRVLFGAGVVTAVVLASMRLPLPERIEPEAIVEEVEWS
jgi:hypothetical protein